MSCPLSIRTAGYILLAVLFSASSTLLAQKKKAAKPPPEEKPAPVPSVVQPVAVAEEKPSYSKWRNELSDVYLYYQLRWPNPFDVRPALEDTIPKGDAGFRIQLLSTPNKTQADSVFTLLKQWTDSTQLDYKLYTYFEFRSPHWRIHVGDFYKINDANHLAARLSTYFPSVWVVRDRIIQARSPYYQRMAGNKPGNVSADSLQKQRQPR
jgi:hypothetical protein